MSQATERPQAPAGPSQAILSLHGLFWEQLPERVSSVSSQAGWILRDPLLAARPSAVSAYAPLAVLIVGVLTGLHLGFRSPTIMSFLPWLVVIGALSAVSPSLGLFWLVPYVAFDLVLGQGSFRGFLRFAGPTGLLSYHLALFLSYFLLAGLVVGIPLLLRRLDWLAPLPFKLEREARRLAEVASTALVGVSLYYLWTQAMPLLIRPLYTTMRTTPGDVAFTLQNRGWTLAILLALVAAGRRFLEAGLLPPPPQRPGRLEQLLSSLWSSLPGLGRHAVLAALVVWTFWGMLLGAFQAIVLFLAVFLFVLGREQLGPRLGPWWAAVSRVPPLLRLAVALGLSYSVSAYLFERLVLRGPMESFLPVVFGALFTLAVLYLTRPFAALAAARADAAAQGGEGGPAAPPRAGGQMGEAAEEGAEGERAEEPPAGGGEETRGGQEGQEDG